MYSYYRDNANMLPMQNAGMMPVQNANVLPVQSANVLPVQNANVLPMQNTGMMPMQNANVLPVQNAYNNAGVMPVQNAYNPMMPVQNACNPMAMPMQNANVLPMEYNQFVEMPTEDLENLYPQTYRAIEPAVENACDKWMGKHGEQCPSKEDFDSMVSDVYNKVEPNVEAAVKNSPNAEERQFYGGGRRILRDFIGAMLIGSLIRRRRRPFFGGFGRPGFGYPGFGGFYGGYPFY